MNHLEVDIVALRDMIAISQKRLSFLEKFRDGKTKWIPPLDVSITDHATVRYLERVMGMDIEAVKRSILTTDRRQAIMAGAHVISGPQKEKYLVQNGSIVTVLR